MAEHVEHMLQRTERALALAEHPTNFTVTGRFAGVPADDLEVELLGRHRTVGVKSEKPKKTAAKTPKQQAAAAEYAAEVYDDMLKTAPALAAPEAAVQAVAEPIAQAVQAVAEPVTQAVQAVAEPVTQVVQAAAEPVTQVVQAVAEPVTQVASTVAQNL